MVRIALGLARHLQDLLGLERAQRRPQLGRQRTLAQRGEPRQELGLEVVVQAEPVELRRVAFEEAHAQQRRLVAQARAFQHLAQVDAVRAGLEDVVGQLGAQLLGSVAFGGGELGLERLEVREELDQHVADRSVLAQHHAQRILQSELGQAGLGEDRQPQRIGARAALDPKDEGLPDPQVEVGVQRKAVLADPDQVGAVPECLDDVPPQDAPDPQHRALLSGLGGGVLGHQVARQVVGREFQVGLGAGAFGEATAEMGPPFSMPIKRGT